MIGSFWNLCRACPSMPVDKLHSEYRSTYRWHEYTGPRQDVVRRPPQPSTAGAQGTQGAPPAQLAAAAGATSARAVPNRSSEEDLGDGSVLAPRFEPALPRRKKHPELAYRTHEFLSMSQVIGSDDSIDSTVHFDRARSEERGGERMRSGRRSKSEGPRREYRLHYLKVASPLTRRAKVLRSDSDPCDANGPEQNLFGWPRGRSASSRTRAAPGAAVRAEEALPSASTVPRKSLSMGAIRPTGPVAVHRKRNTDSDRANEGIGAAELDPLVTVDKGDGPSTAEQEDLRGEEKIQNEHLSKEDKPRRRKEFKTEYKKKFRPFSQYDYVEGKFQKKKEDDSQLPLLPDLAHSDSWYREVLELRKKAGEYKHRGWGTELVPLHIAELYNKQMTLWEQVSRRSSLSALSLASTAPRSITKEEKEKENNKKSSPTKAFHRLAFSRPSTATDKTLSDKKREKSGDKEVKKEGVRSRKEFLVRHHLERTTGSVDGALLPSPTREKLEPVIPRQKEEDLPKSPQKSGSPKSSPRTARSQSVGPAMLSGDRRSPKRQPSATGKTGAPGAPGAPGVPQGERRPRPMSALKPQQAARQRASASPASPASPATTSLTTTAPYRPKSNVGSFKAEDEKSHQVTKHKPLPAKTAAIGDRARSSKGKVGAELKPSGSGEDGQDAIDGVQAEEPDEPEEPELEQQASLEYEPLVVKSPPEPTRVKSPEQILMRSPEPVNWTVPLDTGKTFTVTQNIHQGDFINRPHSEVKAWTPPAVPPPAPQSAPPQLPNEWKSSTSEPHSSSSLENLPAVNGFDEKLPVTSAVAGTTLRCLEDPMNDMPRHSLQEPQEPSAASTAGTGFPLSETQGQGSYRVLEAPLSSTSPVDPYKPLPLLSPSASRSLASDVLDKARNRFDMFWGKGKEDADGNV